ncbi:TonB-dependent receptor, partial [Helicobacter sp. T3_23-1059]
FNMNNDLNPAAGSYDNYNPVATTALPGRSQGLNIDTSLLESITVQDSNVSAAYGGFTGGVVEANTKKATKKYGGNISYQISQGNANLRAFSLTNYHLYAPTEANYENFLNSSSAGNQPEFIKHSIRASVESRFHKKAGIIASFTTTQSFIPLNSGSSTYLAATLDEKRKTQKRQNYNFFIKGHYDVSETLRLEASYAYAPSFSNYFIRNTKNSSFDMLTGGHQAGLKASWDNNLGFFLAQSNFHYMDNSRVNSASNSIGWRASVDKNWTNNLESGTVSEGGYGNVDTKQINFNLKATQDFKPLHFGVAQSKFNAGAEIGYVNAYYERMEDMLFGGTRTDRISPLKANEVCRDDDIACSNGKVYYSIGDWANNNGQYTHALSFYKAGNITLDNVNASAFVENDMKLDFNSYFIRLGEINLRLGARVDYDTYMAKTTLSPRFSLNYILPYSSQKFSTQLTFGANRYYGRNLF